jgi:hypothetical protein
VHVLRARGLDARLLRAEAREALVPEPVTEHEREREHAVELERAPVAEIERQRRAQAEVAEREKWRREAERRA